MNGNMGGSGRLRRGALIAVLVAIPLVAGLFFALGNTFGGFVLLGAAVFWAVGVWLQFRSEKRNLR
jgi:hypothetical protein